MALDGPYDRVISALAFKAARPLPGGPTTSGMPDGALVDALQALRSLGYDIFGAATDEAHATAQARRQLDALSASHYDDASRMIQQVNALNHRVVWPADRLPAVEEVQRANGPSLGPLERAAAPYAAALEYRAYQLADMLGIAPINRTATEARYHVATTTLQVNQPFMQ